MLVDNTKFTFANQLDDTNRGLEFDSMLRLDNDFSVEATYTQYFDTPMQPTFKRFASIIANYEYEQWLLSINGVWRDEVNVQSSTISFTQPEYFLLGTVVSWQFSARSQLSFKAYNLLDKHYDVFDPRMADGAVAGVGREYSVHYQIKF